MNTACFIRGILQVDSDGQREMSRCLVKNMQLVKKNLGLFRLECPRCPNQSQILAKDLQIPCPNVMSKQWGQGATDSKHG